MWLMRPAAALVLPIALGCATPIARTPYALVRSTTVVASNSPMQTHPREPMWREGRLEISYVILLLNAGDQPVTIRPDDVSARLETTAAESQCRLSAETRGFRPLPAEIGPGREGRLECSFRLPRSAAALLATADRVLAVALSVPWPGSVARFPFEYFLRVEDAR